MRKVIQWATGGVGQAAIRAVLDHPDLELVGCWVSSAAKRGTDAGVLAGRDPIGVTATDDIDALLALDADAVIYAPLVADPAVVERILRSGKNVVTPVGWFRPGPRDEPLRHAAAEAGVTLHGIGINPGGVTDLHPIVFSAMTSGVRGVRAEEFSDMRTYNAPDMLGLMGFGADPDEAMQSPMFAILSAGFRQSARLCLEALGAPADTPIESVQEVAVATAPIDSPLGVIAPGTVAALRFRWDAILAGRPAVRIAVNWLMGTENLDPPWTFGAGGERYEIELDAEPPTRITITGWQPETVARGLVSNPGVVATAAHCVNSVPAVCDAAPGIRTCLELPVIAGRFHPDLIGAEPDH